MRLHYYEPSIPCR